MKSRGMVASGLTALAALAALGFILTANGMAMAMFSKLVLFSRVEGVITLDGQPVEGAEVVQEILYKEAGKIPPATVRSAADGRFVLEEVSHNAGVTRLLPGQASVVQRLVIRHDGQEYEAWRHNKSSFEPDSELEGRKLELVCELTTTPDFEGTHYGVCRVAED